MVGYSLKISNQAYGRLLIELITKLMVGYSLEASNQACGRLLI